MGTNLAPGEKGFLSLSTGDQHVQRVHYFSLSFSCYFISFLDISNVLLGRIFPSISRVVCIYSRWMIYLSYVLSWFMYIMYKLYSGVVLYKQQVNLVIRGDV